MNEIYLVQKWVPKDQHNEQLEVVGYVQSYDYPEWRLMEVLEELRQKRFVVEELTRIVP